MRARSSTRSRYGGAPRAEPPSPGSHRVWRRRVHKSAARFRSNPTGRHVPCAGIAAGGTMRLWGGRFGEENDARVADFTRSIEVDAELALDDLRGSIAHVRGLGRAGILTDDEVSTLVTGLEALARDVEAGTVTWDPSLEDVH